MIKTFYILGKMKEGEFGGELIEDIVHIQSRPFTDEEVYNLIKDNYVNDCEDQRIQKYIQPDGGVIWFLHCTDDYFAPEVDEWDDALAAFWVVVHKQGHKEATDDFDRTLHTFHPDNNPVWRIAWQKTFSRDIENTYYHAPSARAAKEKWERQYGKEGIMIGIKGGPY